MKKFCNVAYTVIFALILYAFIKEPSKYMQSFVNGLSAWAYNVLPALFPFAVLTTLFTKCIPKSKFSVTKLLFGVNCDAVLCASLLCGYPIGAKTIADSNADTATACKLATFCSSPNPVFVVATLGNKLLQSTTATAIIIVAQLLAVLINGLSYKRLATMEDSVTVNTNTDFGKTITNSVLSVLSVGGLIALFYMLADVAKSFLPNDIANSLSVAFAIGLLEMTNGVIGVCNTADLFSATVLCSTLIAFGGVCIFAQCYTFLSCKGVKVFPLLKYKTTQAGYATVLTYILAKIFL